MKVTAIIIMSCFLLMACNMKDSKSTDTQDNPMTESTTNKSSLLDSSGNLQAEIEYVYSFIKAQHYSSPAKSAEAWCAINSSWNYEDNGPRGYYVSTDDGDSYVRIVSMHDHYYVAQIFSVSHESICQSLKNIFGEPYSTNTLNGSEYSEWHTDDGINISVEKDGISSSISFAFESLNS